MYRHVSQHDLPLSVQECQRNKRLSYGGSHLNVGSHHARELKVTVFPNRSSFTRDLNEKAHGEKNDSAEPIQNQNIYQQTSHTISEDGMNKDYYTKENEDKLNNNGCSDADELERMQLLYSYNGLKNTSSECADVSTQTEKYFDVDSTILYYAYERYPHAHENQNEFKIVVNNYRKLVTDSEKMRKFKSLYFVTKLNSRSLLKSSCRKSLVKPIPTKSKSSVQIIQNETQYKSCPNCSKNNGGSVETILTILPLVPLVLTSILSSICVIYFIVQVLVMPYLSFLYSQIEQLFLNKQLEASNETLLTYGPKLIRQFVKKAFGFG